jgi:hypothetical protein
MYWQVASFWITLKSLFFKIWFFLSAFSNIKYGIYRPGLDRNDKRKQTGIPENIPGKLQTTIFLWIQLVL